MIRNKLLYTIDAKLFPKVLRRLNDSKNTCVFGIHNDFIFEKTREELKMVPLVSDLEGKDLIKARHTKHILVYHHPYYLIIPIFEYFVFKTGKVQQYVNTLEVKIDQKKQIRGKSPFFNVSFITSRSTIQTFDVVAIKLKNNSDIVE